jgi:amidase
MSQADPGFRTIVTLGLVISLIAGPAHAAAKPAAPFTVEEASIADLQAALFARRVSTVDIVRHYLARIRAYNGTCVTQPVGLLGPISTIEHAGQLNALGTLNLRPATRISLGCAYGTQPDRCRRRGSGAARCSGNRGGAGP